jgi:hypothetical protein
MRPTPVVPFLSLLVACSSGSTNDDPNASPDADDARNGDGARMDAVTSADSSPSRDASSDAPVHTPGPCTSLGAVGTWEHVTPKEVSLDEKFDTPAGLNYGVHSFVVNPLDSAVVYLGTSAQGIYKTTDCGATWKHVNTGKNGSMLDQGRQWTFVIDPVDPNVLYTNTGYSPKGSIAWKSTNGGVDWEEFISPEYVKALQFGSFVHHISIDPTQPKHLIVTPHFECEIGAVGGLPKTKNCLLETMDAGATWRILEGTPGSGEGAGQWMVDSKTWFWAAYFDGLYRTIDGGASWQRVYDGGYADPAAFSPGGGKWFTGGEFNVLASPDGTTWKTIEGSPGASQVTGDGEILFVSRGAAYHSAAVADPTKWTKLPSPPFGNPDTARSWGLEYDPEHHVLYSLNSIDGFWRMRTK